MVVSPWCRVVGRRTPSCCRQPLPNTVLILSFVGPGVARFVTPSLCWAGCGSLCDPFPLSSEALSLTHSMTLLPSTRRLLVRNPPYSESFGSGIRRSVTYWMVVTASWWSARGAYPGPIFLPCPRSDSTSHIECGWSRSGVPWLWLRRDSSSGGYVVVA